METAKGIKFKKSLGQNFIFDKNLLAAIANDAGVTRDDTVLEIGAGAGTLTAELAKKAARVVAVEIDRDLRPTLEKNLIGVGNTEVVFRDILKLDHAQIARLVGGENDREYNNRNSEEYNNKNRVNGENIGEYNNKNSGEYNNKNRKNGENVGENGGEYNKSSGESNNKNRVNGENSGEYNNKNRENGENSGEYNKNSGEYNNKNRENGENSGEYNKNSGEYNKNSGEYNNKNNGGNGGEYNNKNRENGENVGENGGEYNKSSGEYNNKNNGENGGENGDNRENGEKTLADGGFKVVANLPYYITTPVLFHFLESPLNVLSITVMVQKEVAERIAAAPGSKAYGALSLSVQARADVVITRTVGRNMFIPVPEVDSAVVRLCIKRPFDPFLAKVIRGLFGMRRKTVLNNLCAAFALSRDGALAVLSAAEIPPESRGEQLSLDRVRAIAEALQKTGNTH